MSGVQRCQLPRRWVGESQNGPVMAAIIVGEDGYRKVLGILYRETAMHLVNKAGRTHRTSRTVTVETGKQGHSLAALRGGFNFISIRITPLHIHAGV